MDFDKRTIIGLLLIGLIIIFTNTDYYKKLVFGETTPISDEDFFVPEEQQPVSPSQSRDNFQLQRKKVETDFAPKESFVKPETFNDQLLKKIVQDYKLLIPDNKERIFTIETPHYVAEISSKGPSIKSWTLKEYFGPDSLPVQLINSKIKNFYLSFPIEGDSLSLEEFVYKIDSDKSHYFLSESNQQQAIKMALDLGNGRVVVQEFVFSYDKYSFELKLSIRNFETFVDGFTYSLNLASGLNSTERDFENDMGLSKAYALAKNEIEDFDIGDEEHGNKELIDWTINWAATRTKYFTAAIIPDNNTAKGVVFSASTEKEKSGSLYKKYDLELLMPYNRKEVQDRFTIYLGPLKYSTLQSYNVGLENMMSLGPSFIRFLGKIVLWSITHLYALIPNYGVVIIVFSILVKLLLHPLTKKSYQSMKEMQKLQPMMQEMREKYGKDPQKMNAEIMKLYKEHGVNPLGGCLPMLLQLPLLYALFEVFRTTIEFRGAPFVGWINDLSGPDTIMNIPFFDFPLNVLPLVMGATMFLQQKSTITDPKQKIMVYMMPGILTFFFYTFPSGLNLYYTLFNVLTIAHQKWIPDSPKKKDGDKNKPLKASKSLPKRKMSRLDMMRQISKKR
jgi:YidC/Oxa1 family membrane protein insertase